MRFYKQTNMKKNYLLAFLLIGTVTGLSAQNRFGFKAGLNLASEYLRIDNQSSTTKIAPLYHLSAYYDIAVSPRFSIQPGLSLEGKGGKSEIDGESLTDKLMYLEVPINFISWTPTRSGEFFFGGGPYFAYGVDARVTSGRNALHLEWGNEINQLRPFDAGIGLIFGYRFNGGFTTRLSSSAGLVNISNQSGMKYLNRVTSIGIGYEFGSKR